MATYGNFQHFLHLIYLLYLRSAVLPAYMMPFFRYFTLPTFLCQMGLYCGTITLLKWGVLVLKSMGQTLKLTVVLQNDPHIYLTHIFPTASSLISSDDDALNPAATFSDFEIHRK